MKKDIINKSLFALSNPRNFLIPVILFIFIFSSMQFILPQNINSVHAASSLWDAVKTGGVETIGTDAYGSATSKDPRDIVIDVIKVFLTLLGIIFLVLIMLAGYKWMTSQGNQEKVDEAKKEITRAIIGLIIIMAAYAITSFIFTDIRRAITDEVW
ncbi:pilin [Candidatus Parcubacteria bacterium]|nr:pilin [Candidatus Parcubacteria bacterium]